MIKIPEKITRDWLLGVAASSGHPICYRGREWLDKHFTSDPAKLLGRFLKAVECGVFASHDRVWVVSILMGGFLNVLADRELPAVRIQTIYTILQERRKQLTWIEKLKQYFGTR